MSDHLSLGQWGEHQAARYLQRQGLHLVEQHFYTRWGEIDLIFQTQGTWVFVEVKTRSRSYEPSAADAITPSKQKKFIHAALTYIKKNRLEGEDFRFDVVLIEGEHIEWIPGAFEPAFPYTL